MEHAGAEGEPLAVLAARAGFFPVSCPSCGDTPSDGCQNCGGLGRVWTEGGATLDDAGMARLLRVSAPERRPARARGAGS